MTTSFDLLVIGGGPAGAATAMAAQAQGLRVALLEAGKPPLRKVCGEFVSETGVDVWRRLTGRDTEGLPRLSAADASGPLPDGRFLLPDAIVVE